jgi:hypothetical protein
VTLALSIRQPWASLIMLAGKDIENRRWGTKVRGPLLIHAAKGMTRREYLDAMDFADANGSCGNVIDLHIGHLIDSFEPKNLPRGGIIGSVNLTDCVYQSDSPWFQGPYGFVLQDPKPLPFVPFTGQLGFFDVPGVQP